jgi:hypothetical protein
MVVVHSWETAMPLLDHFHPPLSRQRHWENMHSAWANALRDQLNEVLPDCYFAEVQISLSKQLEIDVATFDEDPTSKSSEGGVALWAPPQPPQTLLLPAAPADIFEVRVFTDDEGPQLVAAIELVSPANKDRPGKRHAFAVKCASYLHEGIGLIVVDFVTNRPTNLHRTLIELLGLAPPAAAEHSPDLYAVAYRTLPTKEGLRLELWPQQLTIGEVLPTLPLYLGPDLCLPLHLEPAYQSACSSSRIS